jgi:Type I phosphodiesterase / nucleotide pyrophosphatase
MLILGRMKLLKILLNSLLAGFFASALLALLIADLNVNLKVTPGFLAGLTVRLALTYGLAVCLLSVLVFLLVQFFASRTARLQWFYPSFLLLSFSLLTLAFVVLLRANYRHYYSFFDPTVGASIRAQMIELLLLGLAGLAVYFSIRRYRRRRLVYRAFLVVILVGLALAFGQRWRYPQAQAAAGQQPLQGRMADKKVTVIALEGVAGDILSSLIAKGRLPNFAWLEENGGSAVLAGFSPSERSALEASFETGKLPAKHRRFSDTRYRLVKMKQTVEIAPRFILFRQLTRLGLLEILPNDSTRTVTDVWEILAGNRIGIVKKDGAGEPGGPGPGSACGKLLDDTFDDPALLQDRYFALAKGAFFRDCAREESVALEKSGGQPEVLYFMLDGLNLVETYFYKFSFPQQFGALDQDDINLYGPVIEKYYEFYDALIGKYLTGLKEEELLVVFSPHGIAPLPVWKRFVERLLGDPQVSAYHEMAPEGVIFFYGQAVRRGQRTGAVRIVDIAPTLLYYLGLPVGRDMDGVAASSFFTDEFARENPLIYISSYEDFRIQPPE